MKRRFDELGIEMPARVSTIYLTPERAAVPAAEPSEKSEPAAERAAARATEAGGLRVVKGRGAPERERG
jgi:hypothetical protein